MLSEGEQKRVWEGMIAAEIRGDYFGELSGRFLRNQRLRTWFTLLFSSAAAGTVLSNVPVEVKLSTPLIAAAISLYSAIGQSQKLALDAADLHDKWNRLSLEFNRLWDDMYSDGAPMQLRMLEDQAKGLSKAGLAVTPRNYKRSMLKWQNHVESTR